MNEILLKTILKDYKKQNRVIFNTVLNGAPSHGFILGKLLQGRSGKTPSIMAAWNRRRTTEISDCHLNILFSTDICAASHNHSLMHTLGTLCTKNIMCKTHMNTHPVQDGARSKHTHLHESLELKQSDIYRSEAEWEDGEEGEVCYDFTAFD